MNYMEKKLNPRQFFIKFLENNSAPISSEFRNLAIHELPKSFNSRNPKTIFPLNVRMEFVVRRLKFEIW